MHEMKKKEKEYIKLQVLYFLHVFIYCEENMLVTYVHRLEFYNVTDYIGG